MCQQAHYRNEGSRKTSPGILRCCAAGRVQRLLSVYKTAIDNGLSKQRAASIAKNISVNFNRKGQCGQQAEALRAFFNAAMQGTAKKRDHDDDGERRP
jgi:hypothetical protein